MRAWSRKNCLVAITIFVPLLSGEAIAQNLLKNPYFDPGIEPWGIFPDDGRVFWDTGMDHHDVGSTAAASVHLDTADTESFAAQCVPIDRNVTYVASTWVYAACSGMRFYVFWASNDDCSDTGSFDNVFARSSTSNAWENLTVAATPPAGATEAVVTLVNPGGCSNGAYFDDVMFESQAIFADGFEGEALE
ncbi:MAG TPA: hypothetical protein VHW73_10535 [Rudaea sp.]|jgi:hypothetical protein|nr:hypothetical protein [Rudaea sp.]